MMNRYLWIVCSVMFVGLVALPGQPLAANITPTKAAIGKDCDASGTYSTAMGHRTTASGDYSTAMGSDTTASGWGSTAMGDHTTASGLNSTAMGNNTTASSSSSTAMGYVTTASGWYSTAMGGYTTASAYWSTVIGKGYSIAHNLINDIENSFMVGYMANDTDTMPEFFVRDGGVGINNTDPATWFHVKGEKSGSPILPNHVAAVVNTSSNTNPNVLMLKVEIDNPTPDSNFITFRDSSKNLGSIDGNGSGGIQLNTPGGDFAEYLPKTYPDETLIPGDIVGLFPEGVSKKTQNARRLMVVTSTPAVLGNRPIESEKSSYAPVAFLGQVPVRVKGAFSAGDFIIPSGRADGIGIAVSPNNIKPSQYASVIGRVLTSNTAEGINKATVIVGLPQNELWNGVIKQKEDRITQLEERLAALEAKTEKSIDFGMLPGAGILIGSLGFLWMGRGRKRS